MVEKPPPPPDEEEAAKPLPDPVEPTDVAFQEPKRSPFEPFHQEREPRERRSQGPQPDTDRQPGPLEDFDLGTLEIVGTMKVPGEGWQAYVRAPDGIVHTVTVGDYMGKQYGEVREIGPDSLTLRELVSRGQGRWEPRKRTVEIESRGG
ncbi:pilus assembly protein PilP [Thiohalorhabdus denitrificans]|uniref:Type IV pilus assembly protein PilP n=1 Tax=Thiohalorhabdus denitrificans TaxID=381306 RepID=A0A1G5EEK6_9GAMM|nr:pilus assembly protein PilP [Thiohalorhabdus denitrificans]SCY25191.1 type IV pilus assembly protein PilP [Thiohalorhabdus denitrificans]